MPYVGLGPFPWTNLEAVWKNRDSMIAIGDVTWTNNSSSPGAPWTGHNGIVTRLNNGALMGGSRLRG